MKWQNYGNQHTLRVGKLLLVVLLEETNTFSVKLETIKSKKRFKVLEEAKDFAIVFSKIILREAFKKING